MAYNLPPPDGPDVGPGPGFPGLGGFGFPGFGKSFNLDVGGGFGFPGIGGFGGGYPGWGGPYVPVTPLGSLWGFKGDLIVPMVAIGVAIFILLLIVLAVKYALAWKLEVLDDLAGAKRPFRREAGTAPAEHLEDSNLNRLADIVAAAVYSEGCSRRILCELGSYAREGKQYPSLIRLLELVVPEEYHESFSVIRESAEGEFNCSENYPCGDVGKKKQAVAGDAAMNEIDVMTGKTNGQKASSSDLNQHITTTNKTEGQMASPPGSKHPATATTNEMDSSSTTPGTTAAPSVFGKFKRTMFE